jgi:hypothetical protein
MSVLGPTQKSRFFAGNQNNNFNQNNQFQPKITVKTVLPSSQAPTFTSDASSCAPEIIPMHTWEVSLWQVQENLAASRRSLSFMCGRT